MMSPAAPMTISLEEHVARAIALVDHPDTRWESHGYLAEAVRQECFVTARAAIAAVRERGGAGTPEGAWTDVVQMSYPHGEDPAEAMRAKTLEECEAIAAVRERDGTHSDNLKHFVEHIAALHKDGFPNEAESVVEANELRVAEAMRARCETIARKQENHTSGFEQFNGGWMAAARNIAAAIAALKDNGERT